MTILAVLITSLYPLSASFIFLETLRKGVKQLSEGNNRQISQSEEDSLIPVIAVKFYKNCRYEWP